jgi:hypothetical protein
MTDATVNNPEIFAGQKQACDLNANSFIKWGSLSVVAVAVCLFVLVSAVNLLLRYVSPATAGSSAVVLVVLGIAFLVIRGQVSKHGADVVRQKAWYITKCVLVVGGGTALLIWLCNSPTAVRTALSFNGWGNTMGQAYPVWGGDAEGSALFWKAGPPLGLGCLLLAAVCQAKGYNREGACFFLALAIFLFVATTMGAWAGRGYSTVMGNLGFSPAAEVVFIGGIVVWALGCLGPVVAHAIWSSKADTDISDRRYADRKAMVEEAFPELASLGHGREDTKTRDGLYEQFDTDPRFAGHRQTLDDRYTEIAWAFWARLAFVYGGTLFTALAAFGTAMGTLGTGAFFSLTLGAMAAIVAMGVTGKFAAHTLACYGLPRANFIPAAA